MVDLKKLQKEIYQNKVEKGFNTTDINKEFCLTYAEVAEAYEAWRKKKEDLGEELADVAIYLLGLAEILEIDLEKEIQKKVYKNSKREYKIIDGVNTKVKEFEEEVVVKRRPTMKKIIIIGSPGAGKSVFSQKLKEITNLPLYHLDMLYHKKDGTHISKEELIEKLKNIFKGEEWIIDGNYQRTLELRLKECDTVFLLDFPTDICIEGAKARVGMKRNDLPWIEKELSEEFKESIINFSKEKLPQIYNLLNEYKKDKNIIIFKTREEADNFIKEN